MKEKLPVKSVINGTAVLIRNAAEPVEEGIDDISPFPGVIQLFVHTFPDHGSVRLREGNG